MKPRTLIHNILLTVLTCALATSCIYDKYAAEDAAEADMMKVSFVLNTGEVSTRGSWDTNEKQYENTNATAAENQIDPDKLQLFLYNTNGSLLGKVTNLIHRQDETKTNIYYFSGDVSFAKSQIEQNDGKLSCKIVVLANSDTYTPAANATLSDMTTALTFARKDVSDGLPMWGVKTIENVTFNSGLATDIGTIDLLRAEAKITVTVNETYKDKVTGISLSKSNKSGYVCPANAATTANTNDLDMDNCINPYTATTDGTEEITLTSTDGGKTYSALYIPEIDNSGNDVVLKVTTTTLGEKTIYFKHYDDNGDVISTETPMNIVRNHSYSYYIEKVDNTRLHVAFQVSPWTQVTSQIGYDAQNGVDADFVFYAWPGRGSVYYNGEGKRTSSSKNMTKISNVINSIHGDPKYDSNKIWTGKYSNNGVYEKGNVGDAEASVCLVNFPRYYDNAHDTLTYDKTAEADGYGKSSGVSFYFRLRKPAGAVWKAYLVEEDTTDPNFKFNIGGDNWRYFDAEATTVDWKAVGESQEHVSVATGIAREEPYSITISATHPWFKLTKETKKEGTSVSFDGELTEYGKKWEAQYTEKGGPHADLRIMISTDGDHWYDLAINPKGQTTVKNLYYNDNRRFAVGDGSNDDFHIRIWQLKPTKGKMYDKMQSENPDLKNTFRSETLGKDDWPDL